jgi:putative aminopeptidase FrvX
MLLPELSMASGVSGDESAVRQIIHQAISPHVTDLYVDSMGSLTALKKGTGAVPLRVMLDAHMDEVGFVVTGFENDGLIRFAAVGGFDDRILLGKRVKVGRKGHAGVILSTPIYFGRDAAVKPIKDLRIDIGANSKANAESAVSLGERIVFDGEYVALSETIVRGKAFDDRVGCSLLIDVLQSETPYPVDVLASFSVQEEVGLRGAKVAAQRLKPDAAIVLEGTTAHDVPLADADRDDPTVPTPVARLNGGPVLTFMDASFIAPPKLLAFARKTAEQQGIPYQLKQALGGGTDAGAIHLTRSGVPCLVVSMPCRYIHSPQAILSLTDYQHTLALVKSLLNHITPDVLSRD